MAQRRLFAEMMPRRGLHLAVALSTLLGLLGLAGCGGGPSLPQVKGTVKLAGQPVPGATVIFHPKGGSGSVCYGQVNVEGNYTMMTGSIEGVKPGDYIVTVMPIASAGPPGSAPVSAGPMIPDKYSKKETSELTKTVGEAGDLKYDIDLK